MGLFKKKLTHEEKLNLAYRAYKQDMVETIFPEKKQQADCVVRSLAVLTSTNLNDCDAKDYFDILSIYSGVLIRCVVTHSEDSHIVAMLQQKHSNYIKTKAVAQKILTYCQMNMKNNLFALSSKDDIEALDILTSLFASNEEIAKNNETVQTQNLEDPQYGLLPEKPVYVKGVEGSEEYLKKLRTTRGEKVFWERTGSLAVDHVNGMVDIYEITLSTGLPYRTIYLNMYATKNSTTAPAGFIMAGEQPRNTVVSDPPKVEVEIETKQDDLSGGKIEPEVPVEVTGVKEQYPGYDLESEKKNRLFVDIVSCGIDMLDAYEIIHKENLLISIVTESATAEELSLQEAENILSNITPIIEWTPKTTAEIEEQAVQHGMTIAQAVEVEKLNAECIQLKQKMQQESRKKWAIEAVAVRKAYSAFDLGAEMQKATFKQLLSKEVPMLMAYEVMHRAELFAKKAVVTEPMRPMFCRKCGAKLLSDSIFCMQCGTKV